MRIPVPVLRASLAVLLLTAMAYAAVVPIAQITLLENNYEKFGSLFFPFTFSTQELFALCEAGVSPTTGRCVNDIVSDLISVTNNTAGEGVVAMLSDTDQGQLLIPPDFPIPPAGTKIIYLKETGRPQVLTPASGLPTKNANGTVGPVIRLIATSDLDPTSSKTSDVLVVATQ